MENEFKIVPITNKRIIDMTGEVYGRLTVLGLSDKRIGGIVNWVCQCSCGEKTIVRRNNLRGTTTSCGCYRREKNTTHGESHTRLYDIWRGVKDRCRNPHSANYPQYGQRGITVCDEWFEDYVAFAEWARSNGYQDDLTIDRIDNDLGYYPENCRWVTYDVQASNTSRNVNIEYNGETHNLSEWSRLTGIHKETLRVRYEQGDIGNRLFRPVQK